MLRNIKLESISVKDATKKYLKWVNDKSLTKYTSIKKKQTLTSLRRYIIKNNLNKNVFLYKITHRSVHIGNIRISKIKDRFVTIGILIGDKNFQNKGFGTLAIKRSITKIKSKGFTKIFIFLNKKNKQSLKIFLKNNFVLVKKKPNFIKLKKCEILLKRNLS